MAILKRKKRINDEFAPIGTTGYRIKKFRVLRDMSQTELGVKCGFSEASAVGRISQYETNKQLPRDKEFFKVIAKALEVDENAIFDLDLSESTLIYHLLFEMEECFQASPDIINDVCCIRFGSEPWESTKLNRFIKEWIEAKKEFEIKDDDSEKVKTYKRRAYERWKGQYPPLVVHTIPEENRKQLELVRLQMQMDEVKASMEESKKVLDGIKDKIKELEQDKKTEKLHIRKKSDLIKLFFELLEKGLPIRGLMVKGISSTVRPHKEGYSDMLSIRMDEIDKSSENLLLFSEVIALKKCLEDLGMIIEERVTAYNGVLYVTYSYPLSEDRNLEISFDIWDEMIKKVDFVNDNGYGYDYQYQQQKERFINDFIDHYEVVYTQNQDSK